MEESEKSQHFHGTERTEVGLGRGEGGGREDEDGRVWLGVEGTF